MYLRYSVFNGKVTIQPYQPRLLIAILGLSIVISICYLAYKGSYLTILIANGVASFALMAIFFIFRIVDFSRLSLIMFWLISSILVVAKHSIGHKIVKAEQDTRVKLVVGKGNTAKQYIKDTGLNVLQCDIDDLEETVSKNKVDEIVIALEPKEAANVPKAIAVADKEGLYVTMVPFFCEYIPSHIEIEDFGKTKLINLRATPLDNIANAILKRLIDVIGSLILIVLSSPLMLVSLIGVKLSSKGPILFKQDRVGKDKKIFKMLKFRSMKVNDSQNTAWSTNKDDRRTKFGSFIRKYSIDEIPQFFNVLRGDMSLVGPRPEIPFYVSQFKEEIPFYLVRQQVRPGITGWAQVNGLRGDTSIEKRVEYDIWYIENWSLLLDIKILFLTVFGGKFKNEEI